MPKRYIPNDSWSQKAKQEGFRARSVFKLQELDETFSLFENGMAVLDLGAAPGSWSQYAAQKGCSVTAIDLQHMEAIEGVTVHQADITDKTAMDALLCDTHFDLILSDLAPKTSGIKLIKRFVQVGAFVVLIGVIAASGITSLMESRAKVQRSRERGAAWNKMTEKWRDYGERHADWKRRYALARARLNRAREQGDINDIGTSMEEVSALLEEAKALRAYYRTLQEESDATADAFEREQ